MGSLLDGLFKERTAQRRAEIYKALIHHEGKVGGELFGPVDGPDHRREFFCLDRNTWVWHEEWKDEKGQDQFMMTRYDVRPGGIVKSQGSSNYQKLTRDELRNFVTAVQKYHEQVSAEYNRMLAA